MSPAILNEYYVINFFLKNLRLSPQSGTTVLTNKHRNVWKNLDILVKVGGFELKDFSEDRLVQLFWSTIQELCKCYNIGTVVLALTSGSRNIKPGISVERSTSIFTIAIPHVWYISWELILYMYCIPIL